MNMCDGDAPSHTPIANAALAESQHRNPDDVREALHPVLQRCFVSAPPRIDSAIAPSSVLRTCGDDVSTAASTGGDRAHEGHVGAVGERALGRVECRRRLGHRQRFAGEQRLIDPQRRGREQPEIRRHTSP
jgi:hypothetical protein